MNTFLKNSWIWFTEKFGVSIIHPQFTVIKFQKKAIQEAKKYAKGKLIDIGCGRMPYKKEFDLLIDSYTGVDHPKISKLYHSIIKPDILADAKKLPFLDKSFDIALLLQVLEHVDEPAVVLKEAARVLKPNGILIISVPFFYPLHDIPYDFGRYTETALRSFVYNSNMNIVKMKVQGGFFEFFLQMLNTFLVKRINDIIKIKSTAIVLVIPLIIFSIPIILINNLLILIITFLLQIFPKYPNYFPLDYLIIARKKP